MTLARHARRPDVLFVLPHLGPGGAQRVVSIVTAHLAEEGRRVAIMTLLPRRATHELHEDIRWIRPPAILRLGIGTVRGLHGAAQRVLPDRTRRRLAARRDTRAGERQFAADSGSLPWADRLRVRLIAVTARRLEPAVIMSMLTKTNVLTLLATRGTRARVVISERNRLARHEPDRIRQLRAAHYPACPLVTANASAIVEELRQDLGVAHARLLPNVIRQQPPEWPEVDREPTISVVARLVPQKRVDLAIEAFATLHEVDPAWRLQIIGDGPESGMLRELAASNLPPGACVFTGHLRDPRPIFARSRILILPSAFEGTSNALLEAMSCGVVPLVSEEADPSEELVIEGATGRRFGANDERIAAQLVRLAKHDDLPRLARQAREAAERFTWRHQRTAWASVLFG